MLALTDIDLGKWTVSGRRLHSANYGAVHVVYERRSSAPALTDEELRAQHALVTAIADRSPAVLPARFGSLLEKRDLTAVVGAHEHEIVSALARVRHHVQMTVRVLGQRRTVPSTVQPARMSGREYLERARRAATPPITEEAERLLKAVHTVVAHERREHGAGGLLATIYHLVHVRHVARYRKAAAVPPPGVMVSGPWPPFAFSPQLW